MDYLNLSDTSPLQRHKVFLPEEYVRLLYSVLQRMIDDLECYLCHIDESDYRRFGLAAFHWIFQKTQNDKQVLSVWSVCYMIGCDVNELRKKLIDRQESNDKLRARVVRISDNEFRIAEIKHTKAIMPSPEPDIWSDGHECAQGQASN